MSIIDPIELPVPYSVDEINREFWKLCSTHILHFQQCKGCGHWRHLPRYMCSKCGSPDWHWAPSSGKGVIFSWTVVHQPMHPAFGGKTPYASIIVEMEEGVRIVSQIPDLPIEDLKLDLPVEVYFEARTEDVTLPFFKAIK